MDTQPVRRLYLSTTDRKIFGVCGGVAEYLSADPTIVRLLTLLVFVITGFFPVGLAYLIAKFIVPEPPRS